VIFQRTFHGSLVPLTVSRPVEVLHSVSKDDDLFTKTGMSSSSFLPFSDMLGCYCNPCDRFESSPEIDSACTFLSLIVKCRNR
jgi:hypothetical protein